MNFSAHPYHLTERDQVTRYYFVNKKEAVEEELRWRRAVVLMLFLGESFEDDYVGANKKRRVV